jgi:alpha,alpha-trehalase
MKSRLSTKLYLVTGLFFLFASSAVCQHNKDIPPNTDSKTVYKPRFDDKWSAINDSIKVGWKNHSAKPSNNMVPDTFAYAFSEWTLFYWDLYFTQIGLLPHGELKLAKGGINNLKYVLDKYGFIPNSNADWGDNRSQPPYFCLLVKDVYDITKDKEWLKPLYVAVLKEYHFWTDTSENRIQASTTELGLQRYFHHASERELLELYDHELTSRFGFAKDVAEAEKLSVASRFAAEAETGMDFTARFESRCPDFIAVDLNSNLYRYEKDLAYFEKELNIGDGAKWLALAEKRKELMDKYCWNEARGLYLDYDYVNHRGSNVAAATAFSPLFAGMASVGQAAKMQANLYLFEKEAGIVTCETTIQKWNYQWDHVSVWSPMQSLVIMALDNYGYKEDASRIAMKNLDLIAANYYSPNPSSYTTKKGETVYRKQGGIYEKYTFDGKINDREYPANLMYDWTAGVYAFAYDYLEKQK